MHEEKLKRRMQKSVALASMAAFLLMPVNIAYGANNNITSGSSGIGSLTNITGGQSDYTNITSGFVQNGTGINHFGKFEVNGTADLNGANRYVNMVDGFANINGIMNAFKTDGKLPANVMFISPEGMAIGSKGVLNVGGLQIITPELTDYNALLKKAGADVATITLTEADIANLKNGGDGVVLIGGKVYSTDDVVIKAGNGIYFQNGGVINTNTSIGEVKGIGSISLFTNTGDIVGSSDIHLDSVGNIVLSAKNGGIGQGKTQNQNLYGEKITITPFNVKLAEGKTLDVEVSNTLTDAGDFKGYASVANNSENLTVGNVKGSNVKIVNNGAGTLTTTKAIDSVDKIYLNAENGSLKINENIKAKEIVRLNGADGVVANANLEVTDAGYVSVYSGGNNTGKGNISLNDVTLKSGNINIKSVNGNVELGNVTITQRDKSENVLGLTDNKLLSTGVKAPDTYRFDGVHVESTNGNVVQKANTKIDSAGVVDLTAGGNVNATVKAFDLISTTAKKDVTLNTLNTARLGDTKASNLVVTGTNILVDGKVKGDTVNVNATDKVIVRPNFVLDTEYGHRTYGALEAKGDINVVAQNGILATEQRLIDGVNAPMISSTNGEVNLNTPTGDIGGNVKVSVYAEKGVSANADNVNLLLTGKEILVNDGENLLPAVDNSDGNVGNIVAKNDANISADNSLIQIGDGTAISAGNDMTLDSAKENVGDPNKYLQVQVGGELTAEAPEGGVYIGSPSDLVINKVEAGKDVEIKTTGDLIQAENPANPENPAIISGGDMKLESTQENVGDPENYLQVKVGGELNADAPNGGVYIGTPEDLTVGNINAGKDVVIDAQENVALGNIKAGEDVKIDAEAIEQTPETTASGKPAVEAGKDVDLVARAGDIGTPEDKVSVKAGGKINAEANVDTTENEKGDVNLDLVGPAELGKVEADNNVNITADDDVLVKDIVKAGNDLAIDAEGSVNQEIPDKVALESGNDMTLDSAKENVGDPNKYLQVQVGGELNADAPNGGVYIGTPEDLTVGNINAGKDVVIDAQEDVTVDKINAGEDVQVDAVGSILQADDLTSKPAINAGKDITLKSEAADVGAKDNFLTVDFDGKLDVKAEQGSAYIEGMGALDVDSIVAAEDLGVRTPESLIVEEVSAGRDLILESGKEVEIGTANAGNDIEIKAGDDVLVKDVVKAGNDLSIDAEGSINQEIPDKVALESGNDMTLDSAKENVGDPENYLQVQVGGELNADAPNGGVYIGTPEDLTVGNINAGKDVVIDAQENVALGNIKAGEDVKIDAEAIEQTPETTASGKPAVEAGKDVDLVARAGDIGTPEDKVSVKAGGKINAEANVDTTENEKGDVNLDLVGPAELGKVEADNNVNITADDDVKINDGILAGNDVDVKAEGSITQADNSIVRPAISAGDDIKLESAKEDIGEQNNYLTVDLGGELDAKAPEGSVYIEGISDLVVDNVVAGENIEIKTPENLSVGNADAGKDVVLDAGKNANIDEVVADNDVNVKTGENVIVSNKITAGNDLAIDAEGSINQEIPDKVALESGNDMTLDSAKENVGDPENYLQVQVGGELTATAPEGGVYIGSPSDLVIDKVEAGKDVEIHTKGDLVQADPANTEDPRIISGEDMVLKSDKEDVGDPENYLQVQVGGELTATAPEGGVYIGSPSDLVIDKVEAGKDVEIHTKGDLVQADPANTEDPRIISGEDMVLKSDKEDVGDPENYLQVQVGGELTATAPEGGVYIGSPEDLVIDKIIAKDDVVIDGEKDVVQADPADPEDPRIVTDGDLIISSEQEDVGDPDNYLQVDVGGDIIAEAPNGGVYIGQPVEEPVAPAPDEDDDDALTIDDRDQKSMKYLTDDDNNDASVRNNRQHLRYNVADTDYILVGSNSESGAKVQDVLNISKQGMLVQTTDVLKVGENIEVTMDYKGMPFTVEGKVVRTDAVKGTAGVEFNNIDRLTSSLILYLGMMVNR